MPFMLIYRTSDGTSCHEQADAIDEAALFVECLRNQEGIDEIRLYRMEEISFAFRPYYKVELGLSERHSAPTPSSASTALAVDSAAPEVQDAGATDRPDDQVDAVARIEREHSSTDEDGDTAGVNGRRGLFGR